ncbi:MAG: hypothetical protein ABIG39_06810 [Candidatus Micrarchaeota archaeon]
MDYRPLLLLAVLLLGCTGTKPPPQSEGSYYEIVWEHYGCSGGPCFIEYIVTWNGVVMKKEIQGNIRSRPTILFAKADTALANEEIRYVAENMLQGRNAECEECRIYHVFYHGPEGTKWHAVEAEDASEFVLSVEERSERLFRSSEPQERFFIHLIYKKSGPTKDIHIFGDGTIIAEDFGKGEGELLSAGTGRIDPESLEDILDGFFSSQDNFQGCGRMGFEYSYIEAVDGDRYALVETCGAGETPADILFNRVLELVRE